MGILKNIQKTGVENILITKSLSSFMLSQKISEFDEKAFLFSDQNVQSSKNLKHSLQKVLEETSKINYTRISCVESEFIMVFDVSNNSTNYPIIKNENKALGSDSTDRQALCLMREVQGSVIIFSLEKFNIDRSLDINYMDTPYSFYITEIICPNLNIPVNCIYFFSLDSNSFLEVSIRELTKSDPEYIKKNEEDGFGFDHAVLNTDLIKMTDFEYIIKINYSRRYAYLKDEDFSSIAIYNFIKKEWKGSSYIAQKHNLK